LTQLKKPLKNDTDRNSPARYLRPNNAESTNNGGALRNLKSKNP